MFIHNHSEKVAKVDFRSLYKFSLVFIIQMAENESTEGLVKMRQLSTAEYYHISIFEI